MEKLSPSKEFHEMSLYRPIGESSVKGTVTSGSLNYTYDAGSRLTAITDTNSLAPDFQFVYDTRGQLQNELQNHKLMAKNVLFDRDYDSVGNRIKLEGNSLVHLPLARMARLAA
jgi:YD repeat-containing protein